jgi:hypothetical protein
MEFKKLKLIETKSRMVISRESGFGANREVSIMQE